MRRSMTVPEVVVALALALAVGGGHEAIAQTWDLAADFRLAPNQANPNPDSFGNVRAWAFLQSPVMTPGDPIFPSSLLLLPEFVAGAFSIGGLEQWQANSGGSSTNNPPALGLNATGSNQTVGTLVWPDGVVRLEPSPDRFVAIRWLSYIIGSVRVTLAVSDLDPGCGNGVAWLVFKNDTLLADGIIGNGGALTFPNNWPLSVNVGDALSFVFHPRSDAGCDSTGIGLTIVRTTKTVTIHIPNSINMKSKGKVPVVILSSADFDAPRELDRASLTFGRTGTEASLAFCSGPEDVNGDGLLDLVCHFHTQQTGFQARDTEGILKGRMLDGTLIVGTDSVRILR